MSFLVSILNYFWWSSVVVLGGFFICWVMGEVSYDVAFGLLGYIWKEAVSTLTIDFLTSGVLYMLLICGGIAFIYCFHYFGGDVESSWALFPVMLGFVGVMVALCFTSCSLLTLVFWEYLGVVSFFLILFYSNSDSFRASVITAFASRFGDVCLFILTVLIASWKGVSAGVVSFLFVLVVCTKSASYPFTSWLLEAMRAPTPVSSLVHSSTLVAAGAWFTIRYGEGIPSTAYVVIMFLSLATILISGCSAAFFSDLKKIVALSTCNNISWCLFFYSWGLPYLCLAQLVTHGLCKCLLFMSVGDLMGASGGSQSAVGVYSPRYNQSLLAVLQSILVLSLSGIPFMGVFFTKHAIFSDLVHFFGSGCGLIILFGFFLSHVYSLRLVMLLLSGQSGVNLGFFRNFYLITFFCLFGSMFSLFSGEGSEEVWCMSFGFSLFLFFLQILGSALGVFLFLYFYRVPSYVWFSSLWGNDYIVSGVYRWFTKSFLVSLLSFYRWETGLLGGLNSGFLRTSGYIQYMASLNSLVGLLLFIMVVWFFY
uniref:NADH dehydrogenase subunit 5 n=1 Tax=Carassotrema koreanum TaxID=2573094 RepID=UPI002176D6AD|nr:NADH dehydrogenase subunit 5 [Carassotrema koreanum]UUF92007.1 NADH dehydrogenase subunit 5 [Carassotrema koreanum]